MATEMPYTLAPSRLPDILKEIRSSGTPPKFTNEFLKTTLGFTSSNDRAIIKILRQLGFIDSNGVPTARYNAYKGPQGGKAVAEGLREGWSDLFLSNREIHTKPHADVARRVASITGANDETAKRIAGTFKSLCAVADWVDTSGAEVQPSEEADQGDTGQLTTPRPSEATAARDGAGMFELHHDIHLHLPTTSDPAVYRAIFQAIKTELL